MIEVSNLHVAYGNKTVLEDITISLSSGSCYGILGANGSGKTSFFNCLANLIKPAKGTIKINSLDYLSNPLIINKSFGLMSDSNPLIDEFSAKQYLEFVGLLRNMPQKDFSERRDSLMSFFFADVTILDKKINSFSTGMRKKLAFCAAVIHQPKVLVLDEPFSGLDIVAAEKMISFLQFYMSSHRTILISSHDLGYLEKIVSDVIVFKDRKIAFQGRLNEFTSNGKDLIGDMLYKLIVSNDEKKLGSDFNWLKE